jgi:hypothetical protein
MVCDPDPTVAANPVAWFELELTGFTRETLKEMSDAPTWFGDRKPQFDLAPARDSKIWLHMISKGSTLCPTPTTTDRPKQTKA